MAGDGTEVRQRTLNQLASGRGLALARDRLRFSGDGALGRLAASPAVLAVLGVLVSGVFAIVHLLVAAKGNISAFILAGAGHADRAQLPPGITVYSTGYDGQFYYRLALDPLQWSHSAFGITLDSSYRIVRIAYPALAWLLAVGQRDAVPATLVVINVLAFGALTWCACALARDARRHPAWGLLIPAYWGYLWTIARDLTELVAAAAVLGTILAIRRHRLFVAALCLSVGVLGRETVLVFVAAVAVARLIGWGRAALGRARTQSKPGLGDLTNDGPGATDLVWLVPSIAFTGWEIAVDQRIGVFPVLASVSTNHGGPFVAMAHAFHHYLALFPDRAALLWFFELAVLAFVVLSSLIVFPNTRALLHERLAWIGFLALSVSLSNQIWLGDVGFRSLDELFLLSVVLLLYSPLRLHLQSLATGLAWMVVFVQLARVV